MPLRPKSATPNGQPGKEPLWRQHFPVDSDVEAKHSRRAFCAGIAISGGAMACGQAALNTTQPKSVDSSWVEYEPKLLETNLNEMSDGEAYLFHYPDHRSPCLLVRLSKNEIVAFSQKCTHLACPVIPEVERNRFHCPCHHGAFDIRTGAPTAGPPRTPLPKIRIEVADNGTVVATGVES